MPFENGPHPFSGNGINDNAPAEAGVYGIESLDMTYVGESENVKRRLLEHHDRQSDQSGCIWRDTPTSFYYELVGGGVLARGTREAELIAESDPPCNKE